MGRCGFAAAHFLIVAVGRPSRGNLFYNVTGIDDMCEGDMCCGRPINLAVRC